MALQLSLMTRRLLLLRTQIPKLPSHSRIFSSDDQPKAPNTPKSVAENQYRALLERCESGSVNVKEVRDTVKGMIKGGIKFTGKECVSMMVSFSVCGLENEGKQLLKMVRDKGLAPEEGRVQDSLKVKHGVVYRSIMEALYDKSDEEKISGTDLPKEQVMLDLTGIIEDHLMKKNAREPLKYYLLMSHKGLVPTVYLYHLLVCGLCEYGDAETVKEVANIVEDMTKRWIKVHENACVSIMAGFARVGLENEGKRVLKMVMDNGLGPEEDKVKEALKGKSKVVCQSVMEALYGNY